MSNKSDVELAQAARDALIRSRTEQETQVNAWLAEVRKLPIDKQEELGVPDDLSLKTLIPEMYKDSPDQEQYKKELDAANAFFDRCNAVADEKNREARACLLAFEELSSKK